MSLTGCHQHRLADELNTVTATQKRLHPRTHANTLVGAILPLCLIPCPESSQQSARVWPIEAIGMQRPQIAVPLGAVVSLSLAHCCSRMSRVRRARSRNCSGSAGPLCIQDRKDDSKMRGACGACGPCCVGRRLRRAVTCSTKPRPRVRGCWTCASACSPPTTHPACIVSQPDGCG